MQKIDFVMNMRMNIINNAVIPVMKNKNVEFSILGDICRDQLIYSLGKDPSKYSNDMNKIIKNIFKKSRNSMINIILDTNNQKFINSVLDDLKYKLQYLFLDLNYNISLNIKTRSNNYIDFNINDYKFMININQISSDFVYDNICCNNIIWTYKLSLFDIYKKHYNLTGKFNKLMNFQTVVSETIKQSTSILENNQLTTLSIMEALKLESE